MSHDWTPDRAPSNAEQVPRRVVVATYNVHSWVGTDRRLDPERTARVIARLPADIVALQEVVWPLAERTERALRDALAHRGLHAVWAPARSSSEGHFGNALFTRLPIASERTIDLSYRGREPRLALDVELALGDARLRVVNTHLGLSPRERRAQVRQLVTGAGHDARRITALVGDINEWFMAGRPLRWLHKHFGWSPSVPSFPSRLPLLALDRVWAHPAGVLKRVWVYKDAETQFASDHLPVLAELVF
jgi:endonuclease/exonuclease/phosphatase family metal-dependent hydrolase